MTNEEYKLSQIEDKLDFIIYILGFLDLSELSDEDVDNFNILHKRSEVKISNRKQLNQASQKLSVLNYEVNNILTTWPELKDTFKVYAQDK